MKIIDTHCHYNLDPLHQNWKTHWQNSKNMGVVASIIVGTSLHSSSLGLNIASSDPNLYLAVGIHPNEAILNQNTSHDFNNNQQLVDQPSNNQHSSLLVQSSIEKLQQLIESDFGDFKTAKTQTLKTSIPASEAPERVKSSQKKSKKIVAIGETGLDYFRLDKNNAQTDIVINNQKAFLIAQIELAQKYQLPVVLHVRDQSVPELETPNNAYWDVWNITKHFPRTQFILHCVSGPLSYVKKMTDSGSFVGVAANATYISAEHIRNLVAQTPQDQLLLETDAPYLPPQLYRGQTCQPWMIVETAQFLSESMNLDLDLIYQNVYRCFSLNPDTIEA
jgi:TatD family hydrolase